MTGRYESLLRSSWKPRAMMFYQSIRIEFKRVTYHRNSCFRVRVTGNEYWNSSNGNFLPSIPVIRIKSFVAIRKDERVMIGAKKDVGRSIRSRGKSEVKSIEKCRISHIERRILKNKRYRGYSCSRQQIL